MIYLNRTPITPTMFPDGTSQVWQIPDTAFGYSSDYIRWEFESEAELIHIAQLKALLDGRTRTKRWVGPPRVRNARGRRWRRVEIGLQGRRFLQRNDLGDHPEGDRQVVVMNKYERKARREKLAEIARSMNACSAALSDLSLALSNAHEPTSDYRPPSHAVRAKLWEAIGDFGAWWRTYKHTVRSEERLDEAWKPVKRKV